MKTRAFGQTNFEVTEISFGGAALSGEGGGYGFGKINEADAVSLIKLAYEGGINLFDTAPIYGFGLSEKRLGVALKPFREKVAVVSKSGVSWHENQRVNMTNDPEITHKMLEQSLRDLQSDYIDLYMIHWPDKNVDIRRPMEVLAKAKLEGKIKWIGLCNTFVEDLEKAKEIERVDIVQSEYNFFNKEVEHTIFEYLSNNGIGFMSWGTLDKGILTGRVNKERKFDDSDCRSWAPWWKALPLEERYEKMSRLEPLFKKHQTNGLKLALAHNLSNSTLSTCLCGARNPTQLETLLLAYQDLPKRDIVEECLRA